MSRARCSSRRDLGFTLVELMVTLAVLSVLASLGISRMTKGNRSTATSGLARSVYALCNQARLTALASRKQVWLRLNPMNPAAELRVATIVGNGMIAAGQWGPVEANVDAYQKSQVTGVAAGAMLDSVPPAAPQGMSVDVIFRPDGTVQIMGSATTGATIYLADVTMGYPQRVVLYGRTGFAKVLDR